MRKFELKAEEATLRLESDPQAIATPHGGWKYRAMLRGDALQVDLEVSDDNPASFEAFFQSMAQDWEGWPETRGYESFDGTMRIAATHDRARSVRLEILLRADARSGFDWSASQRMTVDVGALLGIAGAAKAFAGR